MISRIFPRNLGGLERFDRVVVGLAVASLLFVGPTTPLALFGFYGIITGFLGRCPFYALIGMRTQREAPPVTAEDAKQWIHEVQEDHRPDLPAPSRA